MDFWKLSKICSKLYNNSVTLEVHQIVIIYLLYNYRIQSVH